MNRRKFTTQAVLTLAFVAFTASAHAAQPHGKTFNPNPTGPKAPSGFATPDGGGGTSAAIDHDPDPQLDIWVQRCNDAGGGMSTGGDGNYHCTDANGNEIEDY